MSEIKNKFKINGEVTSLQVDSSPTPDSAAFVTSGTLYSLFQRLTAVLDKEVTSLISSGNQDIITSGAVYSALSKKANSSSVTSLQTEVSGLATSLGAISDSIGNSDSPDAASILGRLADIESRLSALEG